MNLKQYLDITPRLRPLWKKASPLLRWRAPSSPTVCPTPRTWNSPLR